MKTGIKLAVIGGGSSYTPELVDGLLTYYSEFPVEELWLTDVPEGREKLRIIGDLARRMVKEQGKTMHIMTTMHRKDAIRGADYVITQLRVGQLDARIQDEKIPLRYGCIGQETTGPGGFANALRTIPVILDICKDIEELAPNAFLINFTNPAGLVTEAVLKYTNVQCIGLCNLPINMKNSLANRFALSVSEIETELVGINHLNWTTGVWVKGIDRTEEILSQLGDQLASVTNIPDLAWDKDLIRLLHSIPCGYLRYYYMTDEMLREEMENLSTEGSRAEVIKGIERELFQIYEDPSVSTKPKQLELRGGAHYSEAAVQLMKSIHNNANDLQVVNVRNEGLIDFLPADAVIEANCVIGSMGARPIALTRRVNPLIRGLLQQVKAYEELTVEAAVHGDKDNALQALIAHPLVPSIAVAKLLLADILNYNRSISTLQ